MTVPFQAAVYFGPLPSITASASRHHEADFGDGAILGATLPAERSRV
jgi:hypothetical protein